CISGGREGATDHRHRLHRRLPSVDRHRRGRRTGPSRVGQIAGQRLAPRARPRMNNGRARTRWRSWLRPGVGIERWLVVVLIGELLLALALVVFIRQQGRAFAPGTPGDAVVGFFSLQFLPDWARPLLLLLAGVVVIGFGLWRLMRAMVEPYAPPDT